MDEERGANQVGCFLDIVFLVAVILIGFFGLSGNGDQTSTIVKLLMAYFMYKVIRKWTGEIY